MSWILPLFSLVCFYSCISEHRTWRSILKDHCIWSPPLAGTTSHYSFHKVLSSSVLDMDFCPHYCQKAGSEPHTSDGWESNLHLQFMYDFLITFCSHASVVTSLRFVLLAGKLALLSIYMLTFHHIFILFILFCFILCCHDLLSPLHWHQTPRSTHDPFSDCLSLT